MILGARGKTDEFEGLRVRVHLMSGRPELLDEAYSLLDPLAGFGPSQPVGSGMQCAGQ